MGDLYWSGGNDLREGYAVRASLSVLIVVAMLTGGCAPKVRRTDPRSEADAQPTPAGQKAGPVPGRERPPVEGRPAPTAICGHAVAMAGWRAAGSGADAILICDPADNAVTGSGGHDWQPQPRALPIHYGKRRPSVVLLPSAAFTITGAIVVTARRPSQPSDREAAAGMPDLSQHFDDRDTGLCGPTSAADVLFAMAGRTPAVLPDHQRGPSARSDAAVRLLIAGDPAVRQRDPASLAGRMGISIGGHGATNQGIRNGIDAWLAEVDPDAWQVSLDWLEDGEKPPSQQQAFFRRLAAAIEGGGGAVVCMWPGSEFADGSVEQPAAETAAAQAANAEPAKPTAAAVDPVNTLPGRPATGSPADAAREARKSLASARRELAAGDVFDALEQAGKAIEVVRPHAAGDADCRAELAAAQGLAAEITARAAAPRATALDKPTVFE
jgi:hypothetical protein